MNYAYKTPDGLGIFQVAIGQPLQDQTKTLLEADLWPVDTTIPEGKQQDFSAGTDGWFVDGGVVRPCLIDIPAKTVEQARLEKLFQIEAVAETSEQDGIVVGDVTLAATDSSLLKIIGLMLFMDRSVGAGALKPNDSVTVYDIDDLPITLSVTQMNALLLGFSNQYISRFSNRKTKLNAVKSATTIEQIEAIN